MIRFVLIALFPFTVVFSQSVWFADNFHVNALDNRWMAGAGA
jgi:hypothetical protein